MPNTHSFETHEELIAALMKNAKFRREHRMQAPFFDLAQKIYERRKHIGWTQNKLAKKAKTHQSRVSKIESGDLDVQLSTLIEIAEALRTKVEINLVDFAVEESQYTTLETSAYFWNVGDLIKPAKFADTASIKEEWRIDNVGSSDK